MRPQLYNILHSVFLCVLITGCGSPTEEISRSSSELLSAITKGDIDAVKEFLKNGTDANVKVKGKGNAAAFCSCKESGKIVELLISNGADVNAKALQYGDDAKRGRGITPLHAAAGNGHVEIAKLLIENGANLNANSHGNTPLHAASISNTKDLVELLIENGANVNAKNDSGESALMRSTQDGNHQIAQLLIDNGANPLDVYFSEKDVSLFQAANKGDVESLSQQLNSGADVNVKNRYGMTPLHVAAKFASKEVIELLIDKKADIDAQSESGQSALHFAISQQEKENFQLLILKGADVNLKTQDGDSLLYVATLIGNREIIEKLISEGLDVNESNQLGDTPLHNAVIR